MSTSAAGLLQCELLGADGKRSRDCPWIDVKGLVGDKIDQVLSWTNQPSLAKLQGQPVRLAFSDARSRLVFLSVCVDNANGYPRVAGTQVTPDKSGTSCVFHKRILLGLPVPWQGCGGVTRL